MIFNFMREQNSDPNQLEMLGPGEEIIEPNPSPPEESPSKPLPKEEAENKKEFFVDTNAPVNVTKNSPDNGLCIVQIKNGYGDTKNIFVLIVNLSDNFINVFRCNKYRALREQIIDRAKKSFLQVNETYYGQTVHVDNEQIKLTEQSVGATIEDKNRELAMKTSEKADPHGWEL